MAKPQRFLAYCLRCCGGGKVLSRPDGVSKRDAECDATAHMNAYGCAVTIIPHKKGAS